MDKINWANYNYDEFELFCNALLTFEFGKSYQPFSAPGRDGGIDGFYSGTYQNESGDWRFQFKFYQAARSEAVSNLKFQLKKEAEKLNGEQFFVLATNIELLPQETKAMIDVFEDVVKAEGKQCKVLIWDGAKLYTLFIQYPILSLWLNDGFKTAQLRDYKDVFGSQLNSQTFEPSSMSNFFIGRQADLSLLEQHLHSDNSLAIVTGEAGIGKTRLVLEFFKQTVELLEDWAALVLVNRQIEFDKLLNALSPGKKYVILIDDAHTYDPNIIADVKAIADSLKNVKVVLTTRNLEAFSALALLKEYERENTLNIKLAELTRQETEDAFLRYIGYTDYRHYINQLVTISFGKPILIVAILNAMSNQIQINQIKSQNFLKDYVKNYFEAFCVKVLKETGIPKVKTRQLLQAVALLEPFNFNDTDIATKISVLLELDQTSVQTALKLLIDHDFVNGRYEQSIKPDYYSDILLSEFDQDYVVRFLTAFIPMVGNIIVNLSSVDEIHKDLENTVLTDILKMYVQMIDSASEIKLIKEILTTIQAITFIKPEIAKSTIDLYLKCLASPNHPVRQELNEDKRYNYFSGESALSKIISMLNYLYEVASNSDFVYRRSFKLYALTEEAKVANIFSFNKKDVIDKFRMERQDFFLKEFNRKYKRYDKLELSFGLLCLKAFAVLDFTFTEWSAVKRDSLNITTYMLPNSGPVKKFRKQLIDILIKLYQSPEIALSRSEILNTIVDIPRGIFATQRNSKPYNNDTEIKSVLSFLEAEADTFNILDRKEILEKLYWFVKWGISQDLLPLIDSVKEAMKPKNLVERLSQLFSKAELSILEMPNVEKYVAEKCDEIVGQTDEQNLANSIIEFLEPQPHPPHYYWVFQNALEINHPTYAKALHDKMFKVSPTLYSIYGSRILGAFYYQHQDEHFFWDQVEVLQKQKKPESDNIILSVYAQRVPDRTTVTERDAEVIIKIFNKNIKENNYMLSMAIQLLFAAKHPQALKVSQKFLERAEQRQSEMFFIRLSDNNTVTAEQMEDLILNHTIRYQLTYEIERCLNRVLIAKGVDVVFDYLVRRYEFKKYIVITKKTLSGYEFIPHDGSHSSLFDQFSDGKLPMFKKGLEWYIHIDGEGGHTFYAKDLLSYLQPGRYLIPSLSEFYLKQIERFSEDGARLERVLESLSIFEGKDETLVQLIVDIFDYVNDYQDTDLEQYKRLRYECYSALTTMGVKSGTPGMPFQVDVDLKNLLEGYLARLAEYQPVTQFLKDVLKSVNADINRGLDRENNTWQ